MAIGFVRATEVTTSALAKYNYNARCDKYQREDLVSRGSANMPDWAESSPDKFWAAADKYENCCSTQNSKKHNCKAKNIIIALPSEMTNKQLEQLTQQVISNLCKDHAVSWAIHRNRGKLSGHDNPHLHILMCERKIDYSRPNLQPEQYFKKGKTCKSGEITGGYRKDRRMTGANRFAWLESFKLAYARITNRELEEMYTCKKYVSFQSRDNKQNSIHLGPKRIASIIRGHKSPLMQYYIDQCVAPAIEQFNKSVEAAKNRLVPKATTYDKFCAFVYHPFDSKKRKKALMGLRMTHVDDYKCDCIRDDVDEAIKEAKENALKATKPARNMLNNIYHWYKRNGVDVSKMKNPSRYAADLQSLREYERSIFASDASEHVESDISHTDSSERVRSENTQSEQREQSHKSAITHDLTQQQAFVREKSHKSRGIHRKSRDNCRSR